MPETIYDILKKSIGNGKSVDLRRFAPDYLESIGNGAAKDETQQNLHIMSLERARRGLTELLQGSLSLNSNGNVGAEIRLKGGVWISKECFDFLETDGDRRVNAEVINEKIVSLKKNDKRVEYCLQANGVTRKFYQFQKSGEKLVKEEEAEGGITEMHSIIIALENKALVCNRRTSSS